MADPALSPAAIALARLVKRDSARAIARKVGVDESSLREWVRGKSKPRPPKRALLAALGVADAWDVAPAADPAPPVPPIVHRDVKPENDPAPRAPPAATPSDEAPVDARAEAEQTVRQLRATMDRLERDPGAQSRELAQVATSLTSATRVLARLNGQTEISSTMIVRSPAWRAVRDALIEALRPFPGALEAAAKALRALEGSA